VKGSFNYKHLATLHSAPMRRNLWQTKRKVSNTILGCTINGGVWQLEETFQSQLPDRAMNWSRNDEKIQ
jgi:hypothetical protein